MPQKREAWFSTSTRTRTSLVVVALIIMRHDKLPLLDSLGPGFRTGALVASFLSVQVFIATDDIQQPLRCLWLFRVRKRKA